MSTSPSTISTVALPLGTQADWWMVGVAALAAGASVWVAILAFTSSREARRIATASEEARVRDEEGRRQREYELRFEDALVKFLDDVGRQLETLRAAISAHHTKSSMAPLIASLEAVRLRARGEDADAMDVVREVFSTAWTTVDLREREKLLRRLPAKIRQWRTGDLHIDEFAAWGRNPMPDDTIG